MRTPLMMVTADTHTNNTVTKTRQEIFWEKIKNFSGIVVHQWHDGKALNIYNTRATNSFYTILNKNCRQRQFHINGFNLFHN